MTLISELIALILIAIILVPIIKFRREIWRWINSKPSVAKEYMKKDLDTLRHYGVDGAVDVIVRKERAELEARQELENKLRDMRQEVSGEKGGQK